MTNVNSLYDTPNREVYLLENVSIQGRKTELRQLLKLLNLAKTGQPKAALIIGDAGIGKSALLNTFVKLVHEGVYCRVLDVGVMKSNTPEAFYVTIMDHLQAESERVLEEALQAVNEITQKLDLHWERADLVRAIALVKLQESIGGKEAVSQEQLVKAIRSQVPALKKLRFSVKENIEKLVDLIVNPWVMIATSLLNPVNHPLQEAVRLAEKLKLQQKQDAPSEMPPTRNPLPPLPMENHSVKNAQTSIETDFAANDIFYPLALPGQQGDKPHYLGTSAPMTHDVVAHDLGVHESYTHATHAMLKPIKDPLVQSLMNVFNFMNSALQNVDSALLWVIDEWDRVRNSPNASEMKSFLSELLYQMTEQKNYHIMVVMTARTEGESYTLGGPLYNHFRTKMLLDALHESACHKLLTNLFKESGLTLDEGIHARILALSHGNPFWHLKIGHYIQERLIGNRFQHVDNDFFDKLSIDQHDNLFELSFTRLKLAFLNDEEGLCKIIASLLKQFDARPFSAHQALKEISTSQQVSDAYVFEVLRAMLRHDLICVADSETQRQLPTGGPYYIIQSRLVLDFLSEKTRLIETDISTDEKIMYLKKIIPLSVKSGDLDREKTMEVLALANAMGNKGTNNDLIQFLEDVFIEALQDDQPIVRVTAINNIALLDSQRGWEALLSALQDRDALVREYAVRNLSLLADQQQNNADLANRFINGLLQVIDDEVEVVRAQIYDALSQYRDYRDLTDVFIKGMADDCDLVRLTAIQNLVSLEPSKIPYILPSLLDALKDRLSEVRRYACVGLQKSDSPETIDALVKTLKRDKSTVVRAMAADALSRMDTPNAWVALLNALRNEASEDVKLAVVRALGKRRGWQTETALQEALQNADWENMPVFTWACARSLGQVGERECSRDLLRDLKSAVSNPIILSAIEFANRQIQERLDELRQMERQLEEATLPAEASVPESPEIDEEEEVELIEEEEIPHLSEPSTPSHSYR